MTMFYNSNNNGNAYGTGPTNVEQHYAGTAYVNMPDGSAGSEYATSFEQRHIEVADHDRYLENMYNRTLRNMNSNFTLHVLHFSTSNRQPSNEQGREEGISHSMPFYLRKFY